MRYLVVIVPMVLAVMGYAPFVFDWLVRPKLIEQHWPAHLIKQAKVGYVVGCMLFVVGMSRLLYASFY